MLSSGVFSSTKLAGAGRLAFGPEILAFDRLNRGNALRFGRRRGQEETESAPARQRRSRGDRLLHGASDTYMNYHLGGFQIFVVPFPEGDVIETRCVRKVGGSC